MPDYNLVSMKMDAKEAKEYAQPTAMAAAPEYPWGLRLELNQDALDKLGIDKLPEVGKKMAFNARVEVVGISQNEHKDGDKHRSVSLQITDLGLGKDVEADEQKPKRDPSDALYGTPEADNLKLMGTFE